MTYHYQSAIIEGQSITLTASANSGSLFSHWSGTDLCGDSIDLQCLVFMDQPYHVQAVFVAVPDEGAIFGDRFEHD